MALSRKQKKAFLTVAVTAGVYLSFRYLLPLIFPFLAAYLMALLLQPSAAFLEKRLRISFRGRMIGVPIGMIGGVELILLSIFLVGLLAAGGRRFTEELEHFLEELPGRMEELSLLGQQFEQSIERVLHLPAGKIGQLFRGTGLQGGGQVKEILLPQLLQKSVPAAAGIVRAVIVVVLFFIASILSLQEMDELRRRRFDSMFHREFSCSAAPCGDRKRMAENPVGHFPDDFGIFDGGAFADWKSILYSGWNRNRGSGCPADLRRRDGAGAVESFSPV